MKKNNYMFYSDYLKDQIIIDREILIAKTKNSFLIGPLLNDNFLNKSFYKRIKSNSIYSHKIYKKILKHKCYKLIALYKNELQDNEIIEIFKNGNVVKHKIIKVPGEDNEK